ncbi:uncharacterized protein PGTG_02419 [Puccinia graminis f. sp. tritici CRL 75-36-700-3]|uniref:Uncharacterized protein n=1 Tax=Puccinia graminis f. sp. tritici (strain CRL 75-36-700-3 / race SCCL) TaxID=418459 RepID=E3JY33_PUCGT|nr:uncharacterized protein PGTG_02419 [Puccinia graminis f. sp. tritici CRL 75-36-700-3]EFP76958.1 hypothetical protein PGTG_02419 [Puccinia graminis f. sp. tritici CRL 75-36-700-3]
MASAADIENIVKSALERQAQQMQAQLESRDEAIARLMSQVELREAQPLASSSRKPAPQKAQPKRSPVPVKEPQASTSKGKQKAGTPNKSNNSNPANSQRTPTNQSKRVVTPKSDSPKVNPLQMISRNMPESFASTRDALYVHIKLIWNLIEQKTIPRPPHPDNLREFNSRFANAEDIERTAEDTLSAALIPANEVVTFKDLKTGRKKVRKGLVNLEEFFISYTQSVLARLGMRSWAPDLEDIPDLLYNEACRQAALKSFRQAAVGGAYAYMNVNKKYVADLSLLIPAYNHYVHYLQASRYNREKTQTGKFRMDEERKVISKARERLRDSRLKFALAQALPKRYQKIISDVNCHSDDEYDPKLKAYVIKTLRFRSANATKFFRRLDAAIQTSDELDGKRPQRRQRIVPATPHPSQFPKPPKGQPLDFYNPDWFNELLPQQRMDVANTREVAFLPDASQSLMGKRLASEKLSDRKFIAHFFDQLSKPYDLTHEIEENGEDDESTDAEQDAGSGGEEIDLEGTSDEEDEDYEEEQEDADFVDDSMQTSDRDNDDGNNEEEEFAREARYNAMLVDDDESAWS